MRRLIGLLFTVLIMLTSTAYAAPPEAANLWDKYPAVKHAATSKKGQALYLVAYNEKAAEAVFLDTQSVVGFLSGRDTLDIDAGYVTLKDFAALPTQIKKLQDVPSPPVITDWCDEYPDDPDQELNFDRTKRVEKYFGPAFAIWELNIQWTYNWCDSEVTAHDHTPSWDALGYIVTQETDEQADVSNRKFWHKHTWKFENTIPRAGAFTKWLKGTVVGINITWSGHTTP